MSKRRDRDFLRDIEEAIQRVISYTSGMTYSQFMRDEKTQDAVIRNIEVIGEEVNNLSNELRAAHPEVPWKDVAGMRGKLIHRYFLVDYDLVWETTTEELPQLLTSIENILRQDN